MTFVDSLIDSLVDATLLDNGLLINSLIGVVTVTVIGCLCALLLERAARRYQADELTIVDLINVRLPQTQCAQCGYPGCRPYAEAIKQGAPINQCPPGGEALIKNLANLLGRPILPLDTDRGQTQPPRIAVIREADCIGCTLCIPACPVDAIIGAPQLMHSVIAADCTGCDLCLEPCPVDCIDMVEVQQTDVTALRLPRIDQDDLNLVEYPCIHCGLCEPACPRELAPQLLHWHRAEPEKMVDLNLSACIECRLCDRVCPSNIPLTATFQIAKETQRQLIDEAAMAASAQLRFEQHTQRSLTSTTALRARPQRGDRKALLDALRKDS
jgi:electron transport complex protein RnfB